MSPSAFPAHIVRVRGTELSFTDEGQGPPVLLVHGHAHDAALPGFLEGLA